VIIWSGFMVGELVDKREGGAPSSLAARSSRLARAGRVVYARSIAIITPVRTKLTVLVGRNMASHREDTSRKRARAPLREKPATKTGMCTVVIHHTSRTTRQGPMPTNACPQTHVVKTHATRDASQWR
jgi:hypothetical protein